MDLISLIDISKHYQMGGQTVKALDSVTVHIAKNDYLAFIGSSGSGKSTMLNILGCLDRPSTGTYHLNGKDVDSLTENELSESGTLRSALSFRALICCRARQRWPTSCSLWFTGISATKRERNWRLRHCTRGSRQQSLALSQSAVGWAASARGHRQSAGYRALDSSGRRANR